MASALAHVALGVLLGLMATPFASPAPAAIQVDLLSSLPGQRAAATPRKKRPAAAPAKSAPKPEVRPKKIVLPANPSPSPRRPRPEPQREYAYDDALASLRDELGETLEEEDEAQKGESSENTAEASRGVALDRDTAAWMLATRRHVRSVWVTPPEFLERPLRTELRVAVLSDGSVGGAPEVVVSSGDPFWDDNAVRAILNASPLPPPPKAGEWRLRFTPKGVR